MLLMDYSIKVWHRAFLSAGITVQSSGKQLKTQAGTTVTQVAADALYTLEYTHMSGVGNVTF
jgi:hypothetical protein